MLQMSLKQDLSERACLKVLTFSKVYNVLLCRSQARRWNVHAIIVLLQIWIKSLRIADHFAELWLWCIVKGSEGAVDNLQSRHKPLCEEGQGPRAGNSCSVEWGKTCRTCRSGISSLCHAAFSIKLQHMGNNLWTWPSNSPGPVLSRRPTSPTPNYINTPLPQCPTDPLTCSPYNMQHAKPNMYYVCSQMQAHTDSLTAPCVVMERSVVILQHRLKGES